MNYTVDNDEDGLRLDQSLAARLRDVSRAALQKAISGGGVSVNSKVAVKKNLRLKIGDTVGVDDVLTHAARKTVLAAQDIPLEVLYEDEFLALINKPAGLVVHPGNGNTSGTVANALLHRFGSVSDGFNAQRPGIVHRLDKDTSGALIIAKTNEAHIKLANLFSSRLIRKVYTGFCIGARPCDHELIELPLARSRRDPIKRIVDTRGNPAVTEYRLRAFNNGVSLLEFILHTGRTHQIRVHCSHRGFPIIEDALYGGLRERVLKCAPLERPFAYNIFKCFSRQALHARSLEFRHPFTNQEFTISAPYPEDFRLALEIIDEKQRSLQKA
ncbi:MAG: RluA family pseudouridine synthase [Chitinispirillales bacterium]|jgi:23S rRNA pseudouridine1911/1915/1917 synthase|nr:RluA family pseudouridine synthase [Chitinispirillales bacterium]